MHTSTLTSSARVSLPAAPALLLAAPILALGWMYWPIVPGLVAQWWDAPEYSHAFLVPLVSLYLAWSRREALARADLRPGYWGLAVMAAALLVFVVGKVGADLFLQRVSFVVMLAGTVLYVAGPAVLTLLAFPLAFLLLMIPLPGIVFNSIAFPLQLLAAQLSSVALEAVGVPVFREGNVMHLAAASLDVEEACSGIRSLLSLTALGVLYGHLAFTSWAPRLLLMLLVAPVAIAANVLRVFLVGLLAHHVSVDTALGVFHTAGGWSVFLVAAGLLLGASRLMRAFGVGR